jgi:hypothetical protein
MEQAFHDFVILNIIYLRGAEALHALVFVLDAQEDHRSRGNSECAPERTGEMKYSWKVIHQIVGKLEAALNQERREPRWKWEQRLWWLGGKK